MDRDSELRYVSIDGQLMDAAPTMEGLVALVRDLRALGAAGRVEISFEWTADEVDEAQL